MVQFNIILASRSWSTKWSIYPDIFKQNFVHVSYSSPLLHIRPDLTIVSKGYLIRVRFPNTMQ
jgi:hypothetical protein